MEYKSSGFSNWTNGSVDGFDFCVKHYKHGSPYGIENGRISKLEIRKDGKIVANYDRGWDMAVAPVACAAYKKIIAEFN